MAESKIACIGKKCLSQRVERCPEHLKYFFLIKNNQIPKSKTLKSRSEIMSKKIIQKLLKKINKTSKKEINKKSKIKIKNPKIRKYHVHRLLKPGFFLKNEILESSPP